MSEADAIKYSLFVFLGTTVGFFREILMAHLYGASIVTDSYFIALLIPGFLYSILVGNSANSVVVPVLTETHIRADDGYYWRVCATLFLYLSSFLLITTLCCMLLSGQIVKFMLSSTEGRLLASTIWMTRWMFPLLYFYGMTSLCAAMLTSRSDYSGIRTISFVQNVIFLIVLLLLPALPLTLICAVLSGAVIAFGYQVYLLRLSGFRFSLGLEIKSPEMLLILKRSLTIILTIGMAGEYGTQFVDLMLMRSYASLFASGSISALGYSYKIAALPIVVFAIPYSIVILPNLVKFYSRGNLEGIRTLLFRSLKNILIILTPLSVLMYTCALPIVSLLFDHGRFDAQSLFLTSSSLRVFALTITPLGVIVVLMKWIFAAGRIKDAVMTACLAIGFDWLFIMHGSNHYGFIGIPWGYAVGSVTTLLFLSWRSFRLIGLIGKPINLHYPLALAISLTMMLITILSIKYFLVSANSKVLVVANLALISLSGVSVFSICMRVFGQWPDISNLRRRGRIMT